MAGLLPEIDRKALRRLAERFRALHRARLQTLLATVAPEPRALIEALPLLLHTNHAALPGFVDFDTPAGIDGYTADTATLAAVRRLALSFTMERFRERSTHIQSLLVSATATGLQAWVMAARSRHDALAPKLAGIAAHARRLGLDLTLRAIDPLDVRSRRTALGPAPRLALDRFYREATLVAGRYPVWWLVPPRADADHLAYAERLRAQRHIAASETFDLGPIDAIPEDECFEAAVDALEACLAAPLSHLPALTLAESYRAGDAPLAERWKAAVFADDPVAADPDALLATTLAAHVTRDGDAARRQALEAVAADRAQWRFGAFAAFDATLRNSLAASLTSLRADARRPERADAAARLDRIAARLVRPGDPREVGGFLSDQLLPHATRLRLDLDSSPSGWRLRDADETVFAASRLAAVAAFLHRHRLGTESVRCADATTRQRLTRAVDALARHLPADGACSLVLLVNAEERPSAAHTTEGGALVSQWDDALDFSGFRVTLVEAVDRIESRNGRLFAHHHRGPAGLCAAIGHALDAAAVACCCVDADRQRIIELRLAEVLAGARRSLDDGNGFAFMLGSECILVRPSHPVSVDAFATMPELLDSARSGGLTVEFDAMRVRAVAGSDAAMRP